MPKSTAKVAAPRRHALEAARATGIAAHAAAGLALAAGGREAARLLRSAEATARLAVALLSAEPALAPPAEKMGRTRRRRRGKPAVAQSGVVEADSCAAPATAAGVSLSSGSVADQPLAPTRESPRASETAASDDDAWADSLGRHWPAAAATAAAHVADEGLGGLWRLAEENGPEAVNLLMQIQAAKGKGKGGKKGTGKSVKKK